MYKLFFLLPFVFPSFLCSAQSDYKTYYEKARKEEIAKDYATAIIDYSIALKVDSTPIDAYYHRGLAKLRLPDFAGAIQDFDKTIELCHNIAASKEPAQMRTEKYYANSYFYRAEAEFQIFKYRLAVIDYSQAMEKGIDSMGDAYNGRGRAKKRLADYYGGDYTDAISDFDKGITLGPHKAFGYYHRGTAEYNAKNYEVALKDISQSLMLDTADADKYYWMGMVQSKLKNYQYAIENFNRSLILNPVMERTYENRGLAEMALNQYDNAYADLIKASKLKMSSAATPHHFSLGPE